MTVPYNRHVSCASTTSYIKILFLWRGSIWKSVVVELPAWVIFYYGLYAIVLASANGDNMALNRDVNQSKLDEPQFVKLCRYCNMYFSLMPLIMLLSFYTNKAFDRWNAIFKSLAHIENSAIVINTYILGSDAVAKIARRSIVRYLCLSQILVYRDISVSVRRRFASIDALISAELLKSHEGQVLEGIGNEYNKHWVPFNWITSLLVKLRLEARIQADSGLTALSNEVRSFRTSLADVYNYDCTPVPLAYPQIVSISTRAYFFLNVLSHLYVFYPNSNIYELNPYFGMIHILEFLVLLAWMKIAETLLNPLGEDDDDLELNYIIDKNISIGMAIVDGHDVCPSLEDDDLGRRPPMYPEDATELGGFDHRLQGSAVGCGVFNNARMVEVGLDKKRSSLRKRSLRGIVDVPSSLTRRKRLSVRIDVPSIYGEKPLTIVDPDATNDPSPPRSAKRVSSSDLSTFLVPYGTPPSHNTSIDRF